MPTSRIAAISSVVATGRRMKRARRAHAVADQSARLRRDWRASHRTLNAERDDRAVPSLCRGLAVMLVLRLGIRRRDPEPVARLDPVARPDPVAPALSRPDAP